MATIGALAGAGFPQAICCCSGATTSSHGGGVVEARPVIIGLNKRASGGGAVLGSSMRHTRQGRTTTLQRGISHGGLHNIASGRQSELKVRAPAAVSEEEEEEAVTQQEGTLEEQETTPKAKVTFVLKKEVQFGESFSVVGSSPELGQWDLGATVPLVWSEDHVWTGEVAVPLGQTVEYKFILTGREGELDWQPGENKTFETKDGTDLVVSEEWDMAEASSSTEVAAAEEEEAAVVPEEDFGNGVAPGTDVVEGIVNAVEMAVEKLDEITHHRFHGGSHHSDDNKNGKSGEGKKEEEASELPVVDIALATAVVEEVRADAE